MSTYWLFLVIPLSATIGFLFSSMLCVGGRDDLHRDCLFWKQKYTELLWKLKQADHTIYGLSEEKANLQDCLTLYKERFGELPQNYIKSQETL